MLKKIAALVQAQGHCVLATCAHDGHGCAPHASLMSFCAAPDGREFWLATRTDTRKCANLVATPRASLLLDDRTAPGGPGLALSVEVELAAFERAGDEAAARAALLARHPGLAGFLADPQVQVLRLLARRFQLLSGLAEVFSVEAEKMLDGSSPTA